MTPEARSLNFGLPGSVNQTLTHDAAIRLFGCVFFAPIKLMIFSREI
jgi:hypothetical protein